MVQIQAHQGYIQTDGRLIFNNTLIRPPKNKIVTIFWEEEVPTEFNSSQQQTVLDVLTSLESIEKEDLTSDDIEVFERLDRGDFKLNFEERLPCCSIL